MKKLLLILLVLGLPACATKQMKAQIGNPIDDVIIKRGNDFTMTELSDGRRMYQWSRTITQTQPGVSFGKETSKHEKTKNGWDVTTTTGWSFGGGSTTSTRTCRYIFVANFDEPRKAWIVSSIKKPGWRC